MKRINLSYLLVIAVFSGMCFTATACGSGQGTGTDSVANTIESDSNMMMTDTSMVRDTAPAAEQPPGAINPGADSARYGTGMGDSSRNRNK